MTALTLNTATGRDWRDSNLIRIGVEAGAEVFAGAIVALSASGHAQAATKGANKKYFGVAESGADNSDGTDGDQEIDVRRGVAVAIEATGTRPLPGATCYLEDDNTVSTAAAGASELGLCIGQVAGSTTQVWVELKV